MNLSELIRRLDPVQIRGSTDRPIEHVVHDSRVAGPRDVFVALRGARVDSAKFVPGLDVAAVIAEGELETREGVTLICVENARRALALASAAVAGDPAVGLPVVGITGTNGKTTIGWLVERIVQAHGATAGFIGTTGHRVAGRDVGDRDGPHHTTPEAPAIQGLLAQMRDAGCAAVAMEVSSIGLALHRADGIPFRVAVFSNLSRDHLDFHPTMGAYQEAKERLFHELLAEDGVAVVNGDDPVASSFIPEGVTCWRYGVTPGSDLFASDICYSLNGSSARVETPSGSGVLQIQLLGSHNLSNALAALGAGLGLGVPFDVCLEGLAALRGIPGRLEPVPNDRDVTVLVDYAHTPEALAHVLACLGPMAGPIRTVFGCGGDRDPGKRSQMGRAASAGSAKVYVTSDNPRSEDPEAILGDIVVGVTGDHVVEVDRGRAIRQAIADSKPGDLVLIAGKGHETTQTIGDLVLPFDDCAVADAALRGGS